jgi:hypothetical protein
MQIGLDELFRETTRGDWSLAAFWLPPIFWRHLLADEGISLGEIQEVLEVVQAYHLFLVRGACRQADGGAQLLPPPRLRSCLALRDAAGAELRIVKSKLPPQMRGLLNALTEVVNEGGAHPFLPVVFAAGPEENRFLFPRARGELQLTARRQGAETLSLSWSKLPAPLEAPRPRPRRRGEVRRA